jgi:hypothetical protein
MRRKHLPTELLQKNLSNKPGWVRLSLHPAMTNDELLFICDAIQKVALYHVEWQKAYEYNPSNNEFESIIAKETIEEDVKEWFCLH